MSRLLQRLQAQAGSARGLHAQAVAHLNLALYSARKGLVDEAEGVADAVRARPELAPAVDAYALLNVVEAFVAYVRGDLGLALAKARRAQVLGRQSEPSDGFAALAAAWLAYYLFEDGQYEASIAEAIGSLERAAADDHASRARACLALASVGRLAGCADAARLLHERARQHAIAEGDDNTVEALLFNRAADHLHQLRLAEVAGRVDDAELLPLSMEIESDLSYRYLIDSRALHWMLQMLDGQHLLLKGDFGSAEARLLSCLEAVPAPAQGRLGSVLHADLAWARAHLGRHDEAASALRDAEARYPGLRKTGDLVLVDHRLAQVFACLGLAGQADHYNESLALRRAEFEGIRTSVRGSLICHLGFLDIPPSRAEPA
jgi:tetratricopeptide (TPR) repeat protein